MKTYLQYKAMWWPMRWSCQTLVRWDFPLWQNVCETCRLKIELWTKWFRQPERPMQTAVFVLWTRTLTLRSKPKTNRTIDLNREEFARAIENGLSNQRPFDSSKDVFVTLFSLVFLLEIFGKLMVFITFLNLIQFFLNGHSKSTRLIIIRFIDYTHHICLCINICVSDQIQTRKYQEKPIKSIEVFELS